MKRKSAVIAALALALTLGVNTATACAEFFRSEDGKGHYLREDGSYATGLVYTQFSERDSAMCLYDSEGVYKGVYTGFAKTSKGRKYYLRGEALTGWQLINGKYYHFGENGIADTGKTKIEGCTYYFSDKGVWSGKRSVKGRRPADFAISFSEGVSGDNRLDTEAGVVEKLIDYGEYASAEHCFSKKDLQVMWSRICESGLLEAPTDESYDMYYCEKVLRENGIEDIWGIEPCIRFSIKITANGQSYLFNGTEELVQATDIDEAANAIYGMYMYLHSYLTATEEYKAFPPSQVMYD